MQGAECRMQSPETQNNNGPHERATLMFARIIFEVVVVVCPTCMICGRWSCCHLNPTLSTNRQKVPKTASAMIASPAPTGKSWTTRSQPSKRIRSLSTLVVTEAASGLQPCVKIDTSKLVMLTQLDVFKTGRGGGRPILPEEICVHLPCLCLSLSLSLFLRAILSSRFIISIGKVASVCAVGHALSHCSCLSRKGHHCRSPVGARARAKACTHPTFSRVLVNSSPLEPCLPLA